MSWWFASGHAVDLVLAIMLVELAWLTRRRGWTVRSALLRLGPGALMLAALRIALTGGGWLPIALALALSFPLHLADVLGGRKADAGNDSHATRDEPLPSPRP